MASFEIFTSELAESQRRWVVTGAAGFIGSNLVEALLRLRQIVVGIDNFSTGHQANLEEVRVAVGQSAWERFTLIEGDICDPLACAAACEGADLVLHQAALGSVPRSISDPLSTHKSNVDGFVNMLLAARNAKVRRFVYAASSSTYGDHPDLPKVEGRIGSPLSPYAVTKLVNELYAGIFATTYGMQCVGLRYFNVFGPRQDPNGPYAAVIPRWTAAMIGGERVEINGDGETSRDFCFVANAVQANLLAATSESLQHEVFNVAVGARTSLNDLFSLLRSALSEVGVAYAMPPTYRNFRAGDVRHSLASIEKARQMLGYEPTHTVRQGLSEAMPWYVHRFKRS